MRFYLAFPFKVVAMGCVVVGLASMLIAVLVEKGLQGRTLREFLEES